MKISILLPTRNRVKELRESLDSLADTADRPSDIEVLLAIDSDDSITQQFEYSKLNVKKFIFGKREEGAIGYYNKLRDFKGDVCWVWSDENICMTRHWDTIIRKMMEKTPARIWMGQTYDHVVNEQGDIGRSLHPVTKTLFSYFPILPRETVETLGFVLPPCFRFWGADSMLTGIMSSVGRLFVFNSIKVRTTWVENKERHEKYKEDLEVMFKSGRANKINEEAHIHIKDETARLQKAIKEEIPRITWRIKFDSLKPSFKSFDD